MIETVFASANFYLDNYKALISYHIFDTLKQSSLRNDSYLPLPPPKKKALKFHAFHNVVAHQFLQVS